MAFIGYQHTMRKHGRSEDTGHGLKSGWEGEEGMKRAAEWLFYVRGYCKFNYKEESVTTLGRWGIIGACCIGVIKKVPPFLPEIMQD